MYDVALARRDAVPPSADPDVPGDEDTRLRPGTSAETSPPEPAEPAGSGDPLGAALHGLLLTAAVGIESRRAADPDATGTIRVSTPVGIEPLVVADDGVGVSPAEVRALLRASVGGGDVVTALETTVVEMGVEASVLVPTLRAALRVADVVEIHSRPAGHPEAATMRVTVTADGRARLSLAGATVGESGTQVRLHLAARYRVDLSRAALAAHLVRVAGEMPVAVLLDDEEIVPATPPPAAAPPAAAAVEAETPAAPAQAVTPVEPAPAPEPVAQPEPEPERVAVVEPEPVVEPERVAVVEPEPEPEPVAVVEPQPVAAAVPPAPTPAWVAAAATAGPWDVSAEDPRPWFAARAGADPIAVLPLEPGPHGVRATAAVFAPDAGPGSTGVVVQRGDRGLHPGISPVPSWASRSWRVAVDPGDLLVAGDVVVPGPALDAATAHVGAALLAALVVLEATDPETFTSLVRARPDALAAALQAHADDSAPVCALIRVPTTLGDRTVAELVAEPHPVPCAGPGTAADLLAAAAREGLLVVDARDRAVGRLLEAAGTPRAWDWIAVESVSA